MADGLGAVVVDTDRVPVPPGAELRAAGAETFDEGAQVWITGPAARGQAQVRDRVAGGGLPVRVEAAGALVEEHVLGRVECGAGLGEQRSEERRVGEGCRVRRRPAFVSRLQ